MKRRIPIIIAGVVIVAIFSMVVWHKLMSRETPQPAWISADQRSQFLYGSVGAEREAGIPYWIWLALPRMFPEYMPGNGGYVSFGLAWEEGKEMPAGFSKKRVGYIRVAANCALCHAASYRKGSDEGLEVVQAVPGRATDIQGLLTFFRKCAEDPRFNAKEIMVEIDSATKLSWADRLLYMYVLIPRTRRRLLKHDDVIIDSKLRKHSLDPYSDTLLSEPRFKTLVEEVKGLKVPPYPLEWDATLVATGRSLFGQHCASCHAPGGRQTGTVIPIGEIGTDRDGPDMTKTSGYLATPLDGIWMRGPYLHNGSVPTVRDLLNPQKLRPATFYVGNNLLDIRNLGFVSNLEREKGLRFLLYNTAQPSHSNSGHFYGIDLSDHEKGALVEYLKTL